MRIALVLVFLLCGGGVFAESNPPAPTPAKSTNSHQEQAKPNQKQSNITNETLRSTFHQIHAEEHAAEANKKPPTDWITRFTLALVVIGGIQAFIYFRQLSHFKKSERAYVKVKPRKPGIEFTDSKEFIGMPEAVCNLEIMNYGTTPARVTDVVSLYRIMASGQPLPNEPEYEIPNNHTAAVAFLVKGESFFNFVGEDLNTVERSLSSLESGENILYLYGYVDYIDAFGQRHRGGFGFEYCPAIDKDVKTYIDEAYANRHNLLNLAMSSYNYDRSRTKGEGNDWT